MTPKTLIYDLTREDIQKTIDNWGYPKFRGEQIWRGLYVDLYQDFDQFTSLPMEARDQLSANFSLSHLAEETTLVSGDHNTVKTLFKLPDGNAIEAVLMKYDKRRTLCISTQAGCAMGCVFCATGQMGYQRNLTSGEIVEQVIYYARILKQAGERITNIVYMGMGEPFHNYKATMASIYTLNHKEGLNIGARRITISTVGLIPGIKRFTKEHSQVNLAVSLHAADNYSRSTILPVNKRYPIEDLIQACRDYVSETSRRITFEWALIQGNNDSLSQAHELGKLLVGLNCHLNIIPLNPTRGFNGEKSSPERIEAFKQVLDSYQIPNTLRVRRGIEIQAGCGQLATKNT